MGLTSGDGVDRLLPAEPASVAEARREVRGLALPQRIRERLLLLVSEIVTNAVLHGPDGDGYAVRLEISMRPGRVHVAVHDDGEGFAAPPPDGVPDPLTVGGQGLVIVAGLADFWGISANGDGCTVWCEVLLTGLVSGNGNGSDVTGAYVRELALEMARTTGAPG